MTIKNSGSLTQDQIGTIVDDSLDLSLSVPAKNSTDNNYSPDVIGNKTDDEDGDSLFAKAYINNKHIHGTPFIYPDGSSPITLVKDAGAWPGHPAVKTEIIPAGTITVPFDFHFLSVFDISANGYYDIKLYRGTAGNEILIGTYAAGRSAAQSQEGSRNIMTDLIQANQRISASLNGSPAGAESLKIKVSGHGY